MIRQSKNWIIGELILLAIVAATLILLPSKADGGEQIKAFQDRSLVNTFRSYTELDSSEIKYLLSLPREPFLEYTVTGVAGTDEKITLVSVIGEWLQVTETECIHFNGCEGKLIYKIE